MMKNIIQSVRWFLILLMVLLPSIAAAAPSAPGFTVETLASGIAGARGVTVDGEGNVYTIGVHSGTVSKITPDGTVSVIADFPFGWWNYTGPYFDPVSGNLFVSDCSNGNIIGLSFNATPNTWESSPFSESATLGCAGGFTSDAAGNIYASDFGSASVDVTCPQLMFHMVC